MKKKFALLGMIAGIVMIFVGLLALCGAFGDASSYGGSSPYSSGYASFGGDYYTYSVNNTAETASAARATASNMADISDILKTCFGLFLMLFGLMGFCGFGIVYAGCPAENTVKSEEIAVPDEVDEIPAPVASEPEEACDDVNYEVG